MQRLLKKSGLKFTMHSAGTTVGKFVELHFSSPNSMEWCITVQLKAGGHLRGYFLLASIFQC